MVSEIDDMVTKVYYRASEGTFVIDSVDVAAKLMKGHIDNVVFHEQGEDLEDVPGGCVTRAKRVTFTLEGRGK